LNDRPSLVASAILEIISTTERGRLLSASSTARAGVVLMYTPAPVAPPCACVTVTTVLLLLAPEHLIFAVPLFEPASDAAAAAAAAAADKIAAHQWVWPIFLVAACGAVISLAHPYCQLSVRIYRYLLVEHYIQQQQHGGRKRYGVYI